MCVAHRSGSARILGGTNASSIHSRKSCSSTDMRDTQAATNCTLELPGRSQARIRAASLLRLLLRRYKKKTRNTYTYIYIYIYIVYTDEPAWPESPNMQEAMGRSVPYFPQRWSSGRAVPLLHVKGRVATHQATMPP